MNPAADLLNVQKGFLTKEQQEHYEVFVIGPSCRGPDKEDYSYLNLNISNIIQPNPMLWVLKRIVSIEYPQHRVRG